MSEKKFLLRISELLQKREGRLVGRCVVCGFESAHGHPVDFSENFCGWSFLQEGNLICEYCYPLCRESQEYRRKSWVISGIGVSFLKKEEVLNLVLNPPKPPFAMYVTKTGKKQGFLQLVNRVNYSRENYVLAFDDELINVSVVKAKKFCKLIEEARKKGFTKKELLNSPSTNRWKDRGLCEKIMVLTKNPLWRLMVYANK
jgi:CRISPR type IV-associated protein Csf1